MKKGSHHSDKTKQKMSEALKGRNVSKATRKKLSKLWSGKNNPNWGKHHSKETRQRISEANTNPSEETRQKLSKATKGKNNPNWLGGISFEPYTLDFNKHLKELIKQRDSFTCQECNRTQKELDYALAVHHIDYDKKNCDPNNLISLCKTCHSQTNFTREDWIEYFKKMLARKIAKGM